MTEDRKITLSMNAHATLLAYFKDPDTPLIFTRGVSPTSQTAWDGLQDLKAAGLITIAPMGPGEYWCKLSDLGLSLHADPSKITQLPNTIAAV